MRQRRAVLTWVTLAAALGLSACTVPDEDDGGDPAWALGDQPTFSGTIPNWSEGDAIAPGEGGIYGLAVLGGVEDMEVGFGTVSAAGDFQFGLQVASSLVSGAVSPAQALCVDLATVDLAVSNPQQRLVVVSTLEVPALYVEGQHARPEGGVLIRETEPTASFLVDRYGFVLASADGTVEGTCSDEGVEVSVDLDLRSGWNSVLLALESGFAFTTAGIPAGASWYLVNPVTLGHDLWTPSR